ncbi:hypothetical protein C8R43DRAFT_1126330 [Mycena crocata]|nr:hypothetical protein C8R43DRAFT_1126330 [Mycena crocata]
MNTEPLDGSSLDNPWILDENGELVLVPRAPTPPGIDPLFAVDEAAERRYRRRMGWDTPTTTSTRTGPNTRETTSTGSITSSSSMTITSTVVKGMAPSAGATRVVRRGGFLSAGKRDNRDAPLLIDDLYLTDARPPILRGIKPDHQCSQCFNMKFYPVSLECGHSDCYVCVRLWLEKEWKCPQCPVVVCQPPLMDTDEAERITERYPKWRDDSKVVMTWDGLTWPVRHRVIGGDSP